MKNMICKNSILGITLSIFALGVFAQNTNTIEEVVVTVQKREQSLQDVPAAVSAFTGDTIEKLGLEDMRGLVDLTPGFSGKTEDSFIDGLALRGISTNDFGVGGDPSVAIFVDGVWSGRNGGVQTSFYDIKRAEVVKGPQNSLFGRNAIGGGINILTQEPVNADEGKFDITAEQRGDYNLSATYNKAFSDSLFFRGSIYNKSEPGWLENTEDSNKLGASDVTSVRLALRHLSDKWDATFRLTSESRNQDPSVYWIPDSSDRDIPRGKISSDLGTDGEDKADISLIQANIIYNVSDDLSISSITGIKNYDFFYLEDYDSTNLLVNHYQQDQKVEYFSEELRLNYSKDKLNVVAGLAYYQEDIDAVFDNFYNEDHMCRRISETDTDPEEGFGPDGAVTGCATEGFADYWGEEILQEDVLENKSERNSNIVKSTGFALFGDVSYYATEQLEVILGFRYTSDTKDMSIKVDDSEGALGNNFNWAFYTDGFFQDEKTWTKLTPRFVLNYLIDDNTTVYLNLSEGYKTGGFSTFGVDIPDMYLDEDGEPDVYELPSGKPLSFEPESVQSAELGLKMDLNSTLRVNLALYSFSYKDLQIIVFESGSQLVKNLGKAESTGLEADITWIASDNLDFRLALGTQSSEITEEIEEGDGSLGNVLPFAPELQYTLLTNYTSGDIFATLQYVYQGESYGGTANFESTKIDAWSQIDLRLGYNIDENSSVTLWINNLTDELYFERGWENADEDGKNGYALTNTLVWPNKPRTVGVTYRVRF